jgi:hypothetical protein
MSLKGGRFGNLNLFMSLKRHIERLAAEPAWTYGASSVPAAEPAAFAALALLAHGDVEAALRPARWLAELQQAAGAVGVTRDERDPHWATSLALLAWSAMKRATSSSEFDARIDSAVHWSLAERGQTAPRSAMIGHDTTLVGWSWAAHTHSWLEPTCFFVLALRSAGLAEHSRTREAVRLLVDRLLPQGGANYGNTIVLGQPLLPHVQPSGVAMWALAGDRISDPRIERSLAYLEKAIGPQTTPASLSFACLGLTAHHRIPVAAASWMVAALDDETWTLSCYERSLLLLALAPPLVLTQRIRRPAHLASGSSLT